MAPDFNLEGELDNVTKSTTVRRELNQKLMRSQSLRGAVRQALYTLRALEMSTNPYTVEPEYSKMAMGRHAWKLSARDLQSTVTVQISQPRASTGQRAVLAEPWSWFEFAYLPYQSGLLPPLPQCCVDGAEVYKHQVVALFHHRFT